MTAAPRPQPSMYEGAGRCTDCGAAVGMRHDADCPNTRPQPDAAPGIASNTPCLGCLHQYVSHGGMFGECALCGCTRFKNPDDQPDAAPGERRFPLQVESRAHGSGSHHAYPRHPHFTVPWSVAEAAYEVYAARYGRQQSLERLAERGGFGEHELLWLLAGAPHD